VDAWRLRNRKGVVIRLGVVAVAATAGGAAYLATRKTKAEQLLELPTSVESYSASLAAYLEAARHGALDAEIIDRLIADLDAVKAESDSGTITIEFSPEQSETLVGIVAVHTRKLAEANQLELSNLPEPANAVGATIIELRPTSKSNGNSSAEGRNQSRRPSKAVAHKRGHG